MNHNDNVLYQNKYHVRVLGFGMKTFRNHSQIKLRDLSRSISSSASFWESLTYFAQCPLSPLRTKQSQFAREYRDKIIVWTLSFQSADDSYIYLRDNTADNEMHHPYILVQNSVYLYQQISQFPNHNFVFTGQLADIAYALPGTGNSSWSVILKNLSIDPAAIQRQPGHDNYVTYTRFVELFTSKIIATSDFLFSHFWAAEIPQTFSLIGQFQNDGMLLPGNQYIPSFRFNPSERIPSLLSQETIRIFEANDSQQNLASYITQYPGFFFEITVSPFLRDAASQAHYLRLRRLVFISKTPIPVPDNQQYASVTGVSLGPPPNPPPYPPKLDQFVQPIQPIINNLQPQPALNQPTPVQPTPAPIPQHPPQPVIPRLSDTELQDKGYLCPLKGTPIQRAVKVVANGKVAWYDSDNLNEYIQSNGMHPVTFESALSVDSVGTYDPEHQKKLDDYFKIYPRNK
ncbi:hypothetical protein BLNAU_7974 [Blattamonas nauphoetae]|uniref:Uncharacterized protein n=1 Tax=Blattamonas nauphoetae TaxID=2049346 RepID=A0ABQ9Y0C3_9EUKA|nr:hypothetical protein BLNAU_7974 [Blattamonas nauphoetae]